MLLPTKLFPPKTSKHQRIMLNQMPMPFSRSRCTVCCCICNFFWLSNFKVFFFLQINIMRIDYKHLINSLSRRILIWRVMSELPAHLRHLRITCQHDFIIASYLNLPDRAHLAATNLLISFVIVLLVNNSQHINHRVTTNVLAALNR